MQKAKAAAIQLTPTITVNLGSRDSIAEGATALVKAGETEAAEALLTEAERLHDEGVKVYAILVMDVSGSMDSAGNIERVQKQLPKMLRPAAGEIPVEVYVRMVTFGDLELADQVWAKDFRPLKDVVNGVFPRESGGCPHHESHLEALMLAVGVDLLREGEFRPGSERLSPLPEGGVELILVTDDEEPRTNRITIKQTRKKLPANCRLTVVASHKETWSNLLREDDKFVRLDGSLSGLLRPVQDAITDAVVNQAAQTVALIGERIQNEVTGLLTAGI